MQQKETRVNDGDSSQQGRDSKRPVLERVKKVNQTDTQPKRNGERMMANGRPPMDGGIRMQPVQADDFSDRQGNALKRRNSQQDTRPHHQGPPIEDRKRQRNAPWPHAPPPVNGGAGAPRQSGPMMTQDPEIQLIDPDHPPPGVSLPLVRAPGVHPAPTRCAPSTASSSRSDAVTGALAAPGPLQPARVMHRTACCNKQLLHLCNVP